MTDWLARGYRLMQPGVYHRVASYGESLMLCEVALEAGAVVPSHTHAHEQISYVVSASRLHRCDTITLSTGTSCVPWCAWLVCNKTRWCSTCLRQSGLTFWKQVAL